MRERLLKALSKPGVDPEQVFGRVAAEVSDDPRDRSSGGDLQYFSLKGDEVAHQRVPEQVIAAAFAINNTHQVSAPVAVGGGIHILMLVDRKPGRRLGKVEARKQVRAELLAQGRKKVEEKITKGSLKGWKVDDKVLGRVKVPDGG